MMAAGPGRAAPTARLTLQERPGCSPGTERRHLFHGPAADRPALRRRRAGGHPSRLPRAPRRQLHRPIGGVLCRTCAASPGSAGSAAEPSIAATRDEHGQSVPNCLSTDPVNLKKQHRRQAPPGLGPGSRRALAWCRRSRWGGSICGARRPAESAATGKPWCRACKQRWPAALSAAPWPPSAEAPLTRRSARPVPSPARSSGAECPGCGQEGRIAPGSASGAGYGNSSGLSRPDGTISPALQGLYGTWRATNARPPS